MLDNKMGEILKKYKGSRPNKISMVDLLQDTFHLCYESRLVLAVLHLCWHWVLVCAELNQSGSLCSALEVRVDLFAILVKYR